MNLWADIDNNEHSLPTTAGRRARLTEQLVLSILRDWLLNEYVARYCRALATTRIFRRCYWIDGLGRERKASVEVELEPVLSLSQLLARESKAITLYGLMLEAGSSKRKEIRVGQNGMVTPAKEMNLPQESGIIRASWLEIAPQLLAELDQSSAVFLLNPFGPTMFTPENLLPLYQRNMPTELCLYVAHKQVEKRLCTAHRSPASTAALTGLLRTDRWKTLSTQEEDIERSIAEFIELFVAAMQRHFQLPVQRIALPVQVGPAAVKTIPYTLLFATRRQDSLMSMNDALCSYERRIYEQSHRGALAAEWFVQQQHARLAEALTQLHQRVSQQGRAQHSRRWPELRQQMLLDNFGQFTQQEYDQVILRLLVEKEVRCGWRRPLAQGEMERVPGNDDALLWSK